MRISIGFSNISYPYVLCMSVVNHVNFHGFSSTLQVIDDLSPKFCAVLVLLGFQERPERVAFPEWSSRDRFSWRIHPGDPWGLYETY